MPTIIKVDGFRLFFYSEEGNEPIHVHVAYGSARAKFWIKPDVLLASNIGLKAQEIRKVKKIIIENMELIERSWNEYDIRRKNP